MEMRQINILKTTKATKFFKITLERTYKVVLGTYLYLKQLVLGTDLVTPARSVSLLRAVEF